MTLEGSYLEVETVEELDSFPVELIRGVRKRKRILGIIKRPVKEEVILMKVKSDDALVMTEPFLQELIHEKLTREEITVDPDKGLSISVTISNYECDFPRKALDCKYDFTVIEKFKITE